MKNMMIHYALFVRRMKKQLLMFVTLHVQLKNMDESLAMVASPSTNGS
jgi:hypothetical protein